MGDERLGELGQRLGELSGVLATQCLRSFGAGGPHVEITFPLDESARMW
ncbi:hypothetical protein SLNWT_3022 [Streptomyces albus]|uniref:Uncharacterized protein n=1 Tax=Streptomyces albus (strain ATCC 21838 / DSM 41398 / FERM P-419 / JCM 4703 / NBRC 107858) TaxID=1081613 RepID=A0A0B5ELW0_STRA4|nr:hypothetical protein SLNWT_3022 [Streptomyces albus]AOU77708.1 hypothetical protein SLNHY_3017 [Streptomyces albus]